MKVSELIEKLADLETTHGDKEVSTDTLDGLAVIESAYYDERGECIVLVD